MKSLLVRTARRQLAAEAIAALGLVLVSVVALGFADGGFYPRPWGWAAAGLGLAFLVCVAVRRELTVSRRALFYLASLMALAAWVAASLVWTRSIGLGVLDLQRLLVYLAGVGAAMVLVRGRSARALVGGVFLGTTALTVSGLVLYLATREVTTDVFQGSHLHRPLGYANAMAITAVIALVLGLGVAVDHGARLARVGAGMALVPLASALALTGSRASWCTLVVGATLSIALTSNRARTIRSWVLLLVAPAAAVLALALVDPTNSTIVGERADRLGERLLLVVTALTVLSAGPAWLASSGPVAERRHGRGRLLALPTAVALGAAIAVGATRLSDLAGERPMIWKVAADEFRDRPLLGSGAGTFAQVWLERRPIESSVRDGHSLPIETLSELGLVGLALVLVLLGLPLVWGVRARSLPLVPATTGAFGAYAAHTSVDWDWELPAVTLAGLFCALTLGVLADGSAQTTTAGAGARRIALAAGAIATALALPGLISATALEGASRALARGDPVAAERLAARAERWQPWSSDPLLIRGRALVSMGDRATALRLFARAAHRDPNDYRVWLALAAVSEGEAAEVAVLRAHTLNPKAVRGS